MSATQPVTKSIRLDPVENELLARLSEAEGISEAALMKRFVIDGMARHRLEKAVTAYRHGEADLNAAAQYAGVSIYRMMTELEVRNITPPASAQKFREGLQTLIDTFGGSDELRQVIAEFDSSGH
jgi:predicted HTH domain antitoxin